MGNKRFSAQLKQNKQVTVKKKIRDELDLEPGDTIWFEIIRVVDKVGDRKYPPR